MKGFNLSLILAIALVGLAYQASGDEPADARASTSASTEKTARESKAGGFFDRLFSVADNSESGSEFLDPDVAFQVLVQQGDADNLSTHWSVADGYYLYKDKISVTSKDETKIALGIIDLPIGKEKHDEYFGKTVSIDHDFQADVPIRHVAAGTDAADVIVQYQGCAEAGLCYPLITKNIRVALNNGAVSRAGSAIVGSSDFRSEQGRIATMLASEKLWFTVITFFGLGLLLTFTPCVLPMIPILSSIIIGQGKEISTARAFTLSLVYVLAMAATYMAAGIIVGLSGESFQIWLQNPWVISAFAGLFVLLSLSMFGFYELQMPVAIQSRLNTSLNAVSSNRQRGPYVGAGVMGLLSALVVSPCVTAPLIGALMYIAATGDAATGGIALFALSMGMGTPLLVIGTSAGKILPRAGAWMNAVKGTFGVLLLALAIWLLERILPAPVILLLAGALLIVSAIYMGALNTIRETASGWLRLWKGLGLVLLVCGVILIIAAAGGSRSLLRPLQGISLQGVTGQSIESTFGSLKPDNAHALPFRQIKGSNGLSTAIQQAAKEGKPVMLDFYADWCISCKEMEAFTFSNANVQESLRDFVVLQVDVTDNDELDQALLKELGLFGPPAILFYDDTGNELHEYRVVGFMAASKFTSHIAGFKQAAQLP